MNLLLERFAIRGWMSQLSIVGLLTMAAIAISHTVIAAEDPITAATFTPDGTAVVIASGGVIELHAWPDLQLRKQLSTKIAQIHDLAFTTDGKALLIAGGNPGESGQFQTLAWATWELAMPETRHGDLIYRIESRKADDLIATASADRTLAVGKNDSISKSFVGHSSGVTALAFLPDSALLLSGSLDHSLRLWDLESGSVVRILDNHTGAVHDLSIRPGTYEPAWIASAGADRTLRFWQPTIGRLLRFVRLPAEPLDIDWINSGEALVCACSDGHVRVVDPDTAEVKADLPALDGWAYTISAAKSGANVLVGGERHQLRAISLPENRSNR